MRSKKHMAILATASLVLGSTLPSHAIVWRDGYYTLQDAQAFGRDHISFFGTGFEAGCSGNLAVNKQFVITAKHCNNPNKYFIRNQPFILLVPGSIKSSGTHDIKVFKLQTASAGTPAGLYGEDGDPNPVGRQFHKAGYGKYGPTNNIGGYWWGTTGNDAPLAGRNTYTSSSTTQLVFVHPGTGPSVATANGDSGGPGLLKNARGKWTVSSTTIGAFSGGRNEANVSTARNWILAQL